MWDQSRKQGRMQVGMRVWEASAQKPDAKLEMQSLD